MIDIDFTDIIQKENMYYDLQTLNNNIEDTEQIILYVNIRSLNANFHNLEIFIESLINKPFVIICAETWNLEYYKFYQLPGYKIYYNNSRVNKADGVVMYIKQKQRQLRETSKRDN